ncbi:unnamed protein product [Adineta steineri]|uniref:Uncharacterized protein n=2 Tax=Adineta steineri TaxID=433720 RepID=A0A815SS22_9BILA|nr:unnamed protein product [Adineta steineri]
MTQTNCYSFLFKRSRSYLHASQNRLANIVERVETTLNNLFHSKSITETQYNLMKINRTSVRMNYLYFVSQTHKEGIPVQPNMICNDGPTEGICRFLGCLLGLLFNDSTHCKKFHKAVNVIHEMEFYQKNGQLQPTTLFATFNIDNLCLMFSHEQVIIALERFLNHCLLSDYHIQGMTIDTILQLVRLVLDNQYFVYNYKFYKQTQGGASGSLLTIPFVHIYLFYWQHDLLNELRSILTMANTQFPQPIWNITEIGSTIHFRDIKISNHNGVLQTNVYHECMYHEPVLPPSLDLLQLPIQRKSIFKAIRYCSTEYSFKNELIHIGIILNIHGFSDETFTQGHEEVIEDFGVIIRNEIAFVPTSDTMRRYLSAYDKYHQIKVTQPRGPQQDINHILNELRSILTMANTQFPQPTLNITEIGSTIHFRDIKISNQNGVLQTSVYHECMYHEPVLPPSLDLLQLPIQRNVWSWLRKSILKAIRYCSTEYSFKNELIHISIILRIHDFSDETFTQGHEEVIEDFGVTIRDEIACVPTYDTMRRHLFAYDKYRQIKATQPPGPQQEIILQLPYPSNWDKTVIDNFEQEINHILKENFENHSQIKQLKIRILQTQENPFPIVHFLIKKRPDVNYLTLPDETKPKPYMY